MNMFLRKLYSTKKVVILSLLFAGLFANSTVFAGGWFSKPVEPEAVNSTTESEETNSQEQSQSSENIRSEENQDTGNIDLGESIPEADKGTDAEKASFFCAKNSDVPENNEDEDEMEEQKTEETASDDQDAKIHEITEDSDGEIIDCIEVKYRENQDTENVITQIRVLKQSSEECGYHAFYNAIGLVGNKKTEIEKLLSNQENFKKFISLSKGKITDKRNNDRVNVKKRNETAELGLAQESAPEGDQMLSGGDIEFLCKNADVRNLLKKIFNVSDELINNVEILEFSDAREVRNSSLRQGLTNALKEKVNNFKNDNDKRARVFVVRSNKHWFAVKLEKDNSSNLSKVLFVDSLGEDQKNNQHLKMILNWFDQQSEDQRSSVGEQEHSRGSEKNSFETTQKTEDINSKQNASDNQDEEGESYSCDEGSKTQENSGNAMPNDDEDEMEEESQQRERENQIKIIIKDKIIASLSSCYPKLKAKYDNNPENYYFSTDEIMRFDNDKELGIDLSKLNSSEKETLVIVVYDNDRVCFLRLKNLKKNSLGLSGGYILIAPQFYDKCEYERLANLEDDEDCDEIEFEEELLLIGVDLHGSKDEKRNLKGLNLKSAILIGANLSDTDLTESDLHKANLTCANLQRAVLRHGTNLSNSILSNTNLSHALLERVNLSDLKMSEGTSFFKAILHCLTFNNISEHRIFSDVNFKRAMIFEVLFNNCELKNINMEWLEADKLSFCATPLYCVDFSNATLKALSILNIKTIGRGINFTGSTIIESCVLGKVFNGFFRTNDDGKYTNEGTCFYNSMAVFGLGKRSSIWLGLVRTHPACMSFMYYKRFFKSYNHVNIDSCISQSNFTGAKMKKVFISNIYFEDCTGLEHLSDAFHSIFKNVHFKSEDNEIQKSLKEKGAKVNGDIDAAYSDSVWSTSDDPDLAKVFANALFGELGRTIVVGGAGAAAGSFVGAGPVAGAASALRVDSALFRDNKK